MRVLIVGSGGREHALAWKISQSPRLSRLFMLPGNAGTANLAQSPPSEHARVENIPIPSNDLPGITAFSRKNDVDLVIVGPEAPLAAGLTDELQEAGLNVFGPSRTAAQIEASKAFAKTFMARHAIPSARFETFNDFDVALDHIGSSTFPIVLKASGLAAGKGVIVAQDADAAEVGLHELMIERKFGAAGETVVVEEYLEGEEVSLLAFTDGFTVKPMPPAQDHKRLLDGDLGPNTGGMGTYAPTPICPPALAEEFTQTILQPTLDGLRAEGIPYAGVLYAGLILTDRGVFVLEFNCRFGDPEAQVILPLLETDLLDIAEACAQERLAEIEIEWNQDSVICVILASGGYPDSYPTGLPITGLERSSHQESMLIFHAGTDLDPNSGNVITAGGRVLGVTGCGTTFDEARERAYSAVEQISFEGMQYRNDIGNRVEELYR